jgi:hypothetical protein
MQDKTSNMSRPGQARIQLIGEKALGNRNLR